MSGKLKPIMAAAAAVAIFIGLGLVFDRGLFLYPFERQGKGREQEQALILATIRAYNAVVADIHATGGVPKMLNAFPATKAIRHELFRDIGFIRDTNSILVYDLAKMTPVDIRMTSYNTAEAVIFEEWNYLYQRKEDRKPISRLKGMGRGFEYRLTKQKGLWLVYAWDPVEVEDPQLTKKHDN